MSGKKAVPCKVSPSVILTLLMILTGPIILVGIPVKLAFTTWFVEFEYLKRNLPPDPYGLDMKTRLNLALLGLEAVTSDEGMEKFKEARLPEGKKAFNSREIKHMEDVRKVLSLFNRSFYFSVALWLAGLLARRNLRWTGKVLVGSSFATLLIASFSLGISLYDYNLAFEVFHNYVFDPYSWRFSYSDTLLRVYPMKLWFDATVFVLSLSVALTFLTLMGGIYLLKCKRSS